MKSREWRGNVYWFETTASEIEAVDELAESGDDRSEQVVRDLL